MEKLDPIDQNQEPENGAGVSGVGALLRASRLRSGLDLQEIARVLCIRRLYLQAIEDGRFGELPGSTYATGFIRTYANYLGLDADEVVRRFRDEAGPGTRPSLVMPTPLTERANPSVAILLTGLLIAILAYGGWYFAFSSGADPVASVQELPKRIADLITSDEKKASELVNENIEQVAPGGAPEVTEPQGISIEETAPTKDLKMAVEPQIDSSAQNETTTVPSEEAANAPLPSPDNGEMSLQLEALPQIDQPSPIETEQTGAEVAEQPQVLPLVLPETTAPDRAAPVLEQVASTTDPEESFRVILKAVLDSWIQVETSENGSIVASRLLRAGDVYNVPNQEGLVLVTGNAGGLSIMVDGKEVPTLGPIGAVRRNVALDPEELLAKTRADN